MKTPKERFEAVERQIDEDLGTMPGMTGTLIKTVLLPQLKSVPDTELATVRKAVRHIVAVLQEAFEL